MEPLAANPRRFAAVMVRLLAVVDIVFGGLFWFATQGNTPPWAFILIAMGIILLFAANGIRLGSRKNGILALVLVVLTFSPLTAGVNSIGILVTCAAAGLAGLCLLAQWRRLWTAPQPGPHG